MLRLTMIIRMLMYTKSSGDSYVRITSYNKLEDTPPTTGSSYNVTFEEVLEPKYPC